MSTWARRATLCAHAGVPGGERDCRGPTVQAQRWEGVVEAEVRSRDPEGAEEQGGGGPQLVTRGIAFGAERLPRQLKGAWAKARSRCCAAGRVWRTRLTLRHPESSWLG